METNKEKMWEQASGSWCNFWNKDLQIFLTISYSIAIFVVMYITVYSLEAFTFYRGVGIVLLFSLVFASWLTGKKWYVLGLLCYAIGMIYVPKNMPDFNAERYLSKETKEEWDMLSEKLENAIEENAGLKDGELLEEIRWENTAVLYTMEPKLICSIPAGFGVNFAMYSDEIVKEAGYLVFSLEEEESLRGDWLEQSYDAIYTQNRQLLDNKYFIQYLDQNYIVYQKRTMEKLQ